MEKLVTWNEVLDFNGVVYRIVREIDSKICLASIF